jgi:succinate-acetate transporter protein
MVRMIPIQRIAMMTVSKILAAMKRITTSPTINLLVGLIFFLTGVIEVFNEIGDMRIGAHHGAIVFGLFSMLKNFPDLVEGMEYIQKSK